MITRTRYSERLKALRANIVIFVLIVPRVVQIVQELIHFMQNRDQ